MSERQPNYWVFSDKPEGAYENSPSHRRTFLHRVEVPDRAGGKFGRVGLVGMDVHVEPEVRVHPDDDVAEDEFPLDRHADADGVAVGDRTASHAGCTRRPGKVAARFGEHAWEGRRAGCPLNTMAYGSFGSRPAAQ